MRILLLLATLIACAGCANVVPRDAMDSRVRRTGFSVARPPNSAWFLRRDEQSADSLMFRRSVSGDTHTVFFSVRVLGLERGPWSDDDFEQLVRKHNVAVEDEQQFEVVSYASEREVRQGQSCVRYAMETIERHKPLVPGVELRMQFLGLACRHPLWPNGFVDAFYSERGAARDLDETFEAEGAQLLEGVTIELSPGTPAALLIAPRCRRSPCWSTNFTGTGRTSPLRTASSRPLAPAPSVLLRST